MGGGTFKHWDTHLPKATWLVNTRGSANRAGPAQSELLHTVEGDKVPVVHIKNLLGKTVWVIPASGKGKPTHGIAFAQGPGYTWWVMQEDGEFRCVPQGDLILGENSQWPQLYAVACYVAFFIAQQPDVFRSPATGPDFPPIIIPTKNELWWNQTSSAVTRRVLRCHQQATIQDCTLFLLLWKTVTRDGAQHHGTDELSSIIGIGLCIKEWYLSLCVFMDVYVYVFIYEGRVMVYWKMWDLSMTWMVWNKGWILSWVQQ